MTAADESGVKEDQTLLVDDTHLRALWSRPSFFDYISQLWRRRHFIQAEAKSKSLGTGRGTFLGKLWIILDPLLQVAVYAVIFGLILKVDRGIDNFIGFLVIGVIYFGFLTSGLSAGSGLIQNSKNMISSFSFPRASLAFSVTLRNMIDNLAPALVAVILALATQYYQAPSWTVMLVVPLFLVLHVFTLGLTLIVARITAFIPDAKPLVALLQRALFFVSGIFFSVERFNDQPLIQEIMLANPFYKFLSAFRICVLHGEVPPLDLWIALVIWSGGTAVVGILFFWQAEARYSGVR
ncbi:ABC transporter permease [Corynebacterium glutamicum]|uniref:ABC transporter permease n=1 Tax=Corynebacterium glutamicum TaxID=1718 RepID=UPI00097A9E1C|nr:ABC transporter permease [Corynebacterium glutamicum]GAV96141.1 ABC transporter permease [Corynebacterium glutamicum]